MLGRNLRQRRPLVVEALERRVLLAADVFGQVDVNWFGSTVDAPSSRDIAEQVKAPQDSSRWIVRLEEGSDRARSFRRRFAGLLRVCDHCRC